MTKFIMLTGKHGEGTVALVDDEDFEQINRFSWYVGNGYARSGSRENMLHMHRLIMKPSNDKVVDHIDGDRLNNKRSNLRICTQKENLKNRKKQKDSGNTYKGVKYKKGKYECSIIVENKFIFIGIFEDEIHAVNAYNYYSEIYFGNFSKPNDCPYVEKDEWMKSIYVPTSKYRGVSYNKRNKKWNCDVYIKEKGRTKYVGSFEHEIEAAIAYNEKCIEMFGIDYDKLNIIV